MKLFNNRFLILRRIVQVSILALFVLGNYFVFSGHNLGDDIGLKVLQGDYSNSLFLNKIPLSDPFAFLQLFAAGGIVAANVAIGAIIIFVLYAILGGRVFCSWVCPMNVIMDLAGYLSEKFGFDKTNISISRNTRYYIVVLTFILSFIFGIAAFEAISPIGILHRNVIFGFGFGVFIILALFLFELFVLKNGFCGYICPLGAFYAIISRFSLLRVKYDSKKCTHCAKCKNICPERQVLNLVGKDYDSFVSSGECTRCGRCIEVCADNALNFSIVTFVKKDKKS